MIHSFLRNKIFRFIISGGTAAVVNLCLLILLKEVLHVWYLHASIIAFFTAVLVGFILQKYWTFNEGSERSLHKQFVYYCCISIWNLCLNTVLVYFFVEYAHFHYVVAQIAGSAIIAFESFIVYRFIFSNRCAIF